MDCFLLTDPIVSIPHRCPPLDTLFALAGLVFQRGQQNLELPVFGLKSFIHQGLYNGVKLVQLTTSYYNHCLEAPVS
jgi:hypothetical protein